MRTRIATALVMVAIWAALELIVFPATWALWYALH